MIDPAQLSAFPPLPTDDTIPGVSASDVAAVPSSSEIPNSSPAPTMTSNTAIPPLEPPKVGVMPVPLLSMDPAHPDAIVASISAPANSPASSSSASSAIQESPGGIEGIAEQVSNTLSEPPLPSALATDSPGLNDITPLISQPHPKEAEGAVVPSPEALGGITQPPGPSSLLGILAEEKALTSEQLDQLKLEEANTGKSLEALIEEKKLVPEMVMTQAKAKLFSIPFVELNDIGVSPEAISQIPESVARRYNLLPFMVNKVEKTLSVAMRNPLDLSAIDFIEKKTGYHILPYFATSSEIERTIGERYAQNLSSEVNDALKETKLVTTTRNLDNLAVLSKEVVREAPITKIVETILGYAVKSRASDIHVEPQEDRTRVRYRIDGILSEKLILPRSVHDAVLSRIKILSDLKIDEKRLPQDGRFTFTADSDEVDLRVSTLPTVHGEKVVLRLLQKNASVPSLAELGLRDQALRDMEESIRIPHGIVLITGPTGSGKTTTLYSILHQINTPKVNISTLEDPVEYQIAGVNQVQTNPQAGLTFASGLRSFLRQDPNIIMVGEVRDKETAELAVQASLTGHLVFSTLHTNSAAGAIPRLLDMAVEPFLLASSLTLVAGQRVVRQINSEYKEEYIPDPVVVADIKKVLGPLFQLWCTQNKKDPEKITLFRAKADRPETEPEYKGRMAIFEVLKITENINKMILEQKTSADIEKVALENGMMLMKQDGYLKALEGRTTIEEVLRVADV